MEAYDLMNDPCLKCTTCTISCPVSRVTDSYPGPKYMGPELERHRLHTKPILDSSLHYCTNCKTCELVCPENLPISKLIINAKRNLSKNTKLSLRDLIFSCPDTIGKLSSPMHSAVNMVMKSKLIRNNIEKYIGISKSTALPEYGAKIKTDQKIRNKSLKKKVLYFTGCYAKYNDQSMMAAVEKILNANGYEVVVPPQKCCGLSAINNGNFKKAESNAKFNIESFLPYVDDDTVIVTTCTSCALTLKKDYGEILAAEQAPDVASKIYDLCEFLLSMEDDLVLPAKCVPDDRILGYHAPCHLKALGIGLPSIDMLQKIGFTSVTEIDSGCCGSAGTYGLKKEKYQLSMAIGKPLFDSICDMPSDVIVTECPTCKIRIEDVTEKTVYHPVKLIAEAYESL